MTKFHQQSFNSRLATMGDPSEEACDKVYGYRTHKLGLDRKWQNGVGLTLSQMTTPMRYTPDRQVIDRNIECMGIGRDKTLKIKQEKIAALIAWQHIGPIDLFVFDQPRGEYYQAPIALWQEAAITHGEVKSFPEGKLYYALDRQHFPSEAKVVPNVKTTAPV